METENKKIEELDKKPVEATKTTEIKSTSPTQKTSSPEERNKNQGNRRPRQSGHFQNSQNQAPEFEEKIVDIARVTTVVKGGRRFSFSAVVVIGNKKGQVGYGHGKANEVPDAIKKAVKDARNNLITVPIVNGTVPHIIQTKYVSSSVLLKPAPKGSGLIASGSVRSVVELAGYKDIVTKSIGSSNKTNVVKATLQSLSQLRTVEQIAKLRGVNVKSLISRKEI